LALESETQPAGLAVCAEVWFIRPIDDHGDMRFLDNVSAGVKVGCDLRINEDI
jgi:hypothetical protein